MKRIDRRSEALTRIAARTNLAPPRTTRLPTAASRAVGPVGRQLLAAADRRGHGAESRGASAGAGLGALIGSFAGPLGAIVGGGVGGLLGYALGATRGG